MMTQPEQPSLAPSLAPALAADLRALVGKLKRRLREQTKTDQLTPTQISVILRLESDGAATMSHLARAEGMRPQSMGAVISALEQAGLVGGAADPRDGRQTLLSLTETCQALMAERRAARQDWLSRTIQAKLAPHEQRQLADAVTLLKRLTED